ncbi:MAG: hypothetical protein PHE17_21065, partial [Thiothrix sp.]|uniref:hypothetical protein n=1 Tax=Thiothrix sp. TaxID=1032 RepID=UPI002630C3E2
VQQPESILGVCGALQSTRLNRVKRTESKRGHSTNADDTHSSLPHHFHHTGHRVPAKGIATPSAWHVGVLAVSACHQISLRSFTAR